MKKILNITNGDCTVEIMRKAGIPGDFLPWQDALHEGPVPDGLTLSALSKIRADFLAGQGLGDLKQITADFAVRDRHLRHWRDYSKVVLWFEHDLYDQLQLLQILAWFSGQPIESGQLSLVVTEHYLGMLKPAEIGALYRFEQPIAKAHLDLSKTAWRAFCSASPVGWFELLNSDTSVLPFLQGAIHRLLEEYPSTINGLSRTQHQTLQIVSQGPIDAGHLFVRYQETEQRRFLGDVFFWVVLKQMLSSTPPLLELSGRAGFKIPIDPKQKLTVTPSGLEVLHGDRNWLELHHLDRWLGGVYLTVTNVWLWNAKAKRLVRASA